MAEADPTPVAPRDSPRPSRRFHVLAACLAAVSAVALLLAHPLPALAHANLVYSDPPAGAVLAASPAVAHLWFTEPIVPGLGRVAVYDTARHRVDQGNGKIVGAGGEELEVGLPSLGNGLYTIVWQAQSAVDGHETSGAIPFFVGPAVLAPPIPAASTAVSSSSSGSPAQVGLRWLYLVGLLGAGGALLFGLVVQAPALAALRREDEAAATRVSARWRRLDLWLCRALLAGGIAGGVGLLVATVVAAAQPNEWPAAFAATLQSQYGILWLIRLGLSVALWARWEGQLRRPAANVAWPETPRQWLAACFPLALFAAIALTFSLASHSDAAGDLTAASVVLDWLHATTAGVWLGGLAELAIGLFAARHLPAITRTRLAAKLALRFAWVGGPALAVLGVSGLYEGWLHVGSWSALLNTAYGAVLDAKVIVVVAAAALAALNHFVVRYRLLVWLRRPNRRTLWRALLVEPTLRSAGALELALVAAAVLGAAWLGSLSPARQVTTAEAGPLDVSQQVSGLDVRLQVLPGRLGQNTYAADVTSLAGANLGPGAKVVLRLTYLDAGQGSTDVTLANQRAEWSGQGSELATMGNWQAQVVVQRPGLADAGATFRFDLTPNGTVTPQPSLEPFGVDPELLLGVPVLLAGLVLLGTGFRIPSARQRLAITTLTGGGLATLAGVILVGLVYVQTGLVTVQGTPDSSLLGHIHGPVAGPSGPGLTLAGTLGGTTVYLETAPADSGPNDVGVALLSSASQPITGAVIQVTIAGQSAVTLADRGDGTYLGSETLPWSEPWTTLVQVTLPGQPPGIVTFTFASPTQPGPLLNQSDAAMNALRRVTVTDVVQSGANATTTRRTTTTYAAPNLQVFANAQIADDVLVTGEEPMAGVPCTVVTFVDDATDARYVLWVGLQDDLVRRETVTQPGRFEQITYSGFLVTTTK